MPDQTPDDGQQVQPANGSWKDIAVRWVSGQPFNNVLTLLLVIGAGLVLWYGLPVLINEVREQRNFFNIAVDKRDVVNEQQRKEFISWMEKADARCEAAIKREHEHAKEMLDRILRGAMRDGRGLVQPELPATAKKPNH